MAGILCASRFPLRWLLSLVFVLALTPAAVRADAASDERVRQAALWRDAALQLEVIEGRRTEAARAQELAQAVSRWRAEAVDPAAEIAAARPALEAYLSLDFNPGEARWPSDKPAEVYAGLVRDELAAARSGLANAAAAGASPGPALGRAARAYGLTNGLTDLASNFDRLDADVAAAMGPVAAAPPPPFAAPPPNGDGLRWMGVQGDRVGQTSGALDGQPDVEFELTFPMTAPPVQMINLSLLDPAGNLCCQAWSTADARFRFLGVSAPGGTPAQAFAPVLGYPPTTVRLHASGAELFARRVGVQATVVFANGTYWTARTDAGDIAPAPDPLRPGLPPPPQPAFPPPDQPAAPAYPLAANPPPALAEQPPAPVAGPDVATLAFNGVSVDQVSHLAIGADGKPDGIFALDLRVSEVRAIRAIALVSGSGARWTSDASDAWYLGVSQRAGLKNGAGQQAPLATIGAGDTRYNLHASDRGAFRTGEVFRVTVSFEDGGTLTAETTLGAVGTPRSLSE